MDFNRPPCAGKEIEYITDLIKKGQMGEHEHFVTACEEWLKEKLERSHILMTSSCTHALEIASFLLNIQPGDEIILPSYTFVSTANAFVLRGAVPVFVDIRSDTLNMDETLIEAAITSRTRAILVVHYAGVSCDMDAILACAKRHHLAVVEDAAQGVLASYKGRPLGTMGAIGTLSFDVMKNLSAAGQGGAIILNDSQLAARAEIILHKGTNRRAFQRGDVPHYEWKDFGSFYTMGSINAAYLYANMEASDNIQKHRMHLWETYRKAFTPLENAGHVKLQTIPKDCQHNAHIFSIRLGNKSERDRFIKHMRQENIPAIFHYVPLHEAPAGKQFGRVHGTLDVTLNTAETLVRLPLFYGLTNEEQEQIIHAALKFF